jgi:dTDP-4-dehydrorhamnose reductase
MKIAVSGANGLLGQHLVARLLRQGHEVLAFARGEERISFPEEPLYAYHSVDIRDADSVKQFFGQQPFLDAVVHAAALTQVDHCELHRKDAYDVNVNGTDHLLKNAYGKCGHFVYVSTDFVFDGSKGLYSEDDPRSPVNYYGETKRLAEDIVGQGNIPWSIARTCLVYGNTIAGTRSNIISWVKENLEAGKSIKVVSDQVRTPTYIKDLVDGILLLLDKQAKGTFHLSGKDVLTPFEMACATADHFKLDRSMLEKVDATVFSQPAQRPLRTGFDISKAIKELRYAPVYFSEGITDMYA